MKANNDLTIKKILSGYFQNIIGKL